MANWDHRDQPNEEPGESVIESIPLSMESLILYLIESSHSLLINSYLDSELLYWKEIRIPHNHSSHSLFPLLSIYPFSPL
jgi:hypothetical protein